jgi:ubiquinone/menaquinone biosynthesis C-methylase UbiE
MGVAAHLGIRVADYDESIRTFIPHYENILDAAADAVATSCGRSPHVVDLGTGSGALASRVIQTCRRARIVGIDADTGMLALARRRLRSRMKMVTADFTDAPLPRCDVVTASFALHHIQSRRAKSAMYAKCFAALTSGGVIVNADCCLSSSAALQARDRAAWHRHLARNYGRAGAERYLRAWAKEDRYFTLDEERRLLTRAGFKVDIVWRRDCFAVMVGSK